jgi:DHA2 family multidrug resistance protein
MSGFTIQTDLRTFVIYRCVQAGAIGFLFVPVNTAMYAYVPPGKNNNASALVNLARNIGGSVGISLITTFLERRQQFHQSRLVEKLTPFNHYFQHTLSTFSHYFSAHGAGGGLHEAYALTYRLAQQQAGMLAYADCYYVLAFAFLLLIPLVFLLKPTRGHGGTAVH